MGCGYEEMDAGGTMKLGSVHWCGNVNTRAATVVVKASMCCSGQAFHFG